MCSWRCFSCLRCCSGLHAGSGPFLFRGMCQHVSSFWLWGVSAEPAGWHHEDGLESLILWHPDLGGNTAVCIEPILTIHMSNTYVYLRFPVSLAAADAAAMVLNLTEVSMLFREKLGHKVLIKTARDESSPKVRTQLFQALKFQFFHGWCVWFLLRFQQSAQW